MRIAGLLGAVLLGCSAGPGQSPAGSPARTESTAEVEPRSRSEDSGKPGASAPTPGKAASEERPARSAPPPGVSPLSKEEQVYAKTQCKPLLAAIERQAKKKRSKGSAIDLALKVLQNPPKAKNVDAAKCSALLIRDLETYRAKTIEIEALQTLKRIGAGLASALSREPPGVCPSAPPTPKSLGALAKGPVETTASDWKTDGWRCAGFAAAGPIRFQYEPVTDQKAKQYEIIARGYPGSPTAPTELVFRVPYGSGEADLTQPVYRR